MLLGLASVACPRLLAGGPHRGADASPGSSAGAVSVGYAPPGGGRLRAAHSLASGDGSFVGRGAVVTLLGALRRDSWWRHGNETLLVDSIFEVATDGGMADVPVAVWHETTSPVANSSSTLRYLAPVERSGGLRFQMSWRPGELRLPWRLVTPRATDGDARHAHAVRLTVGGETGEAKLRQGTYVLGASDVSGGGVPDWQAYEIRPGADGSLTPASLVRRGWLGPEPPGLEGVILSIERA